MATVTVAKQKEDVWIHTACEMCLGAMFHARIARAVYGATDPKKKILKPQTVVETLHIGPYDELPNAYAALSGWIAQNGLEPVWPVRERYLNEPGPDVPPTAYRTVIAMPIAEVAVPAR